MRMRYMYSLLKDNYQKLESLIIEQHSEKIGANTTNYGLVKNWTQTREALVKIKVIPSYADIADAFLNNPYFEDKQTDSFRIPYQAYNEIWKRYIKFLEHIEGVINFCEDAGFDVGEQGFDVKLPQTEDFGEFAENVSSLYKALSQCPYLQSETERIVLKKTDIGSIWLEFAVAATGASIILFNLAKLVDMCIKIISHRKVLKQQEELIRAAKLKNDVLEKVVEVNNAAMEKVLDKSVEALSEVMKREKEKGKLSNEEKSFVKYTLKTLTDLIDKGMEIYASIDAPKEIQDVFPTADEMTFLPTPQKLLKEEKEE